MIDKNKIAKEVEKLKATIQSNKDKADALLNENTELNAKVEKLNKAIKMIEKQEKELANALDGVFETETKKAKTKTKEVKAEVKEDLATAKETVENLFSKV